jgi:carboxypeptidase Taq
MELSILAGRTKRFMDSRRAYEWLREHSRDTACLGSIRSLLNWDRRTKIPRKGTSHRVDQVGVLARMLHERETDPRIGEMLDRVEGSNWLGGNHSDEAVNVREWSRNYRRLTRIPQDLAIEIARAAAEGESAWESARAEGDWEAFRPSLERLLDLKKRESEAVGYAEEPYDALLDVFEPEERTSRLQPLFRALKEELVSLLEEIDPQGPEPGDSPLRRNFPAAEQEAFCLLVADRLGYDLDAGRLDTSAHPFTSAIGPGDVRITTRYDPNDLAGGLFSTIHETGHALYYQGLPGRQWGTPMGRPVSLGVNESQSRLWENQVGRSRGFWEYFAPLANKRFRDMEDVSPDDFYSSVNRVERGLIRTEADEVTYNLHIMVRFELELALFRGELTPTALPGAWNEAMRDYLGIEPPDHRSGALQDIHWSAGQFGYFPTYTLGNLYAAQFYAKAEQELGAQEGWFARGEFSLLLGWLRARIHRHGCRHLPRDLVRNVTGEDLNHRYLVNYLREKYRPLYPK